MSTPTRDYETNAKPFDGPHTELGRAIQQLRFARAIYHEQAIPLTLTQQAEVGIHVQWALDNLCSIDAADVERWFDEEHCARCGEPSVAVVDDHGAPYCASCWPREVERQARLDDDVTAYRCEIEGIPSNLPPGDYNAEMVGPTKARFKS